MEQPRKEKDFLAKLFVDACLSGGGASESLAAESAEQHRPAATSTLRITSEQQWRKFSDSLISEGFVTEQSEQQRLHKLWHTAVVGANAFGRRGKASLSLQEVYMCVDDMCVDDISAEVEHQVADAQEAAVQLAELLDAWNIHTFAHTQTRQGLQIIHRLQGHQHRAMRFLEQEQDRQRDAFIKESVLRLTGGTLRERKDSSGEWERPRPLCPSGNDDELGCFNQARGTPRLWQFNNATLVDQKVAKARFRAIRYPGIGNNKIASSKANTGRADYGGIDDDPWGVSQGLAGRQGVCCRRAYANRGTEGEEFPVTVLVMPKVGLSYAVREILWRAFLAHRQLVLGSCIIHTLGFADRDPGETLFYYQHIKARPASALLKGRRFGESGLLFRHWARCALVCLAQISEQSTFTLEKRLSLHNLMIGGQGAVVRLGRFRWGPELQGEGAMSETLIVIRDTDLCLSLANMLEELLGLAEGGKREEDAGMSSEPNAQPSPSPILANLLAYLRLPQQSRERVGLKVLVSHQYFAPLSSGDMELKLPIEWKAFVGDEPIVT